MPYYWKHSLFKLTKDQDISTPEIPGIKAGETKYFAGQLVLSAENPTKISTKLEQHCSAIIRLADYRDDDVANILLQRIAVCGITVKDEFKLVDAIVQAVNQDIKLAVKLLEWAYKCCRAEAKETVLIRHLNKALKLWG